MKLLYILLLLASGQVVMSQTNFSIINRENYSISYPSTLRIDESRTGIEFVIYAKRENSEDDFSENINLVIQDLKNMNIDLNKYVAITEDQIINAGILIESKRIKKNNFEFHRIVYKATMDNRELKFIQYDFVKEEKAYILTFTSELEEFDNYSKVMEGVMKNFVLK